MMSWWVISALVSGWEWFKASPPATIITALSALIIALRTQSNFEHRKTLRKLVTIDKHLNGGGDGLIQRIEKIERTLGIGGE